MVLKKKRPKKRTDSNAISLNPLDFETAIRAAMATGKPPTPKRQKGKQKAKR